MARSKGSAGWQPVVEYVGAHMHEEVPDERLERAVIAMSGQLGALPSHVEASLRLGNGRQTALSGAAVSRTGKVAIAYWVLGGEKDLPRLYLAVWEADGFSEPAYLLTGSDVSVDFITLVSFPEGSEEPAVCTHGKVFWGGASVSLPDAWRYRVLPEACLTLWEEDGRRFVAYVHEGTACQLPIVPVGCDSDGGSGTFQDTTRWLGRVGGSLARITVERRDGVEAETLRWQNAKVVLPLRGRFLPALVGCVAGRLQGVAYSPDHLVAYRLGADGASSSASLPVGVPFCSDRGELYCLVRELNRVELRRFDGTAFVAVYGIVGIESVLHRLLRVGPTVGVLAFGQTFVVSNFSFPAKVHHGRVVVAENASAGQCSTAPNTSDDLAVARFHHGFGTHRRGDTFRWEIPTADNDVDTKYRDFPLYRAPFDRLVEAEDARGKAVMSWHFAHGTFHVLRYDLPD